MTSSAFGVTSGRIRAFLGRHRRALLFFTDAALVCLAGVSGFHLLQAQAAKGTARAVRPIARDTLLQLPGAKWVGSDRHLILRLSTTCPGTKASLPFFQAVTDSAHRTRTTRVTVVTHEPEEIVSKWLAEHDLHADEIVTIKNPASLGFLLVPTSLMADRTGRVTDVLLGSPSTEDGARFLTRVERPDQAEPFDNTSYPDEIDQTELQRRRQSAVVLVLDIRDRSAFSKGHLPQAVNIPRDELATRAPREIPGDSALVLDCRTLSLPGCRVLARTLDATRAIRTTLLTQ